MATMIAAGGDLRRAVRHAVRKQGRIVTTWQRYGIGAEVTDIGIAGARLRVDRPAHLPPTFMLWIDADQIIYPARICWRKGSLIGVEFTEQPRRATIGTLIAE
jgi:hypothetical protein